MAQRPNPRIIGVCALIALYSDPNSLLHNLEEERSSTASSDNKIALFLDESILGINHENGNQIALEESFSNKNDTAMDMSASNDLKIWIARVKHRLGIEVAELLRETLGLASESVDALMDLFDSLKGAVSEGLVDSTSFHGQFLRQFCLGFEQLSFESTILLWQALKERVSIIHQSDPDDAMISVTSDCPWPLSVQQIQSKLHENCVNFEINVKRDINCDFSSTNEDDQPEPSFEQMEIFTRKMLNVNPGLPAAHFLRYLNCLRHGERAGALDALHEYFDHSMVKNTFDAGRSVIDGATGARTSRDIMQFSVIVLALAHSSFGDSNLALLATEEAVRVAQQSKDADCVAFALGWLYEHHGQGTAERQELLRRCASRALDGHLRPLVAGTQLTLAKDALRDGNSETNYRQKIDSSSEESRWTKSWNHLLQVVVESNTDNSGVLDRPTYLSQNPKEVLQSMALQRLVSAGIWDSLGMPCMSKWASEAALTQENKITRGDLLAAIQNISRCTLHGDLSTIRKNMNIGQHQQRQQQRDSRSSHPHCAYARAVSAMLQLRTKLRWEGNTLEEPSLHSLALIFHEWAVRRGDLEDARALQTMLESCLHPGLQNKDKLYADIRMQKYLYYCRTQNWKKAKDIGTSLVKYTQRKGLVNNQAKILIEMAILELETDRKKSTTALPSLLEALALCGKWELHSLHSLAMSILAKIFLRLNNPKRSIAILNATLPILIQREHIWYQAEAYLTLAKAYLKLDSNFKTRNGKATSSVAQHIAKNGKYLQFALHALNKSMFLFEECHERHRLREVYYLQAQIHSLLSNTEKRDDMSEKYIRLGCTGRGHVVNTNDCLSGHQLSILDTLSNPLTIKKLLGRSMF